MKRIAMQYKYVSRPGFFLPNTSGTGTEIAEGTLLPFLRPLAAGVPLSLLITESVGLEEVFLQLVGSDADSIADGIAQVSA